MDKAHAREIFRNLENTYFVLLLEFQLILDKANVVKGVRNFVLENLHFRNVKDFDG